MYSYRFLCQNEFPNPTFKYELNFQGIQFIGILFEFPGNWILPSHGKALVPGPGLKIVFDWDRSFFGRDRDGGETKIFVSRTATTLFY
jgi:hypothetical protein